MRAFPRALISFAVALVLLFTGVLGATAAAPTAPNSPTNLSMAKGGKPVLAGGWINSIHIALQFDATVTTNPVTPQVEVQPAGTPFTGTANYVGKQVSSSGPAVVHVWGLKPNQEYHWQARLIDRSGAASDWVPFSNGRPADFGIDKIPPSRPVISSPTDPRSSNWYNNRVVTLHWTATDSGSGILGYHYVMERTYHGIKPGPLTPSETVHPAHLGDGVWYVAVRAEDRAGNWGPMASFRLQLQRSAPSFVWLSPAHFAFNPYRGTTPISFELSQAARVTLNLYRVGSKTPVHTFNLGAVPAHRVTTIQWAGRQGKGFVPKGYYFINARAVDAAGNITRMNYGGISVNPMRAVLSATGQPLYPDGGKVIIVSLSRQELYAYDGTHLFLSTLVTTGNPSLPTPLGTYHILARYSPFEFISPWPVGSPYYYAPSWVHWAMLFQSQGYFLHDAPWRSVFGPGSNGPGQPGTNYGGTHGCVNIPPGPMEQLWNWTPMGTTVEIVP